MQRPKNEGLGAAFGGGMTDNLFGAQTTNVLQTFTRNLGVIFFVLAVVLSVLYAMQSSTTSEVERRLREKPAPPAAEKAPEDDKSAVTGEETQDSASESLPNPSVAVESNSSETEVAETDASPAVAAEPVTDVLDESPAEPVATPPAKGE